MPVRNEPSETGTGLPRMPLASVLADLRGEQITINLP